jgi:hypothetical protein
VSTLFRSPDYAKGATRRPGSFHFHVDIAFADNIDDELVRLAQKCEQAGWPAKVTRVARARPGRHYTHAQYEGDYREHTPELGEGRDTFAAYLTALLPTEDDSALAITKRCEEVKRFVRSEYTLPAEAGDVVVEVERVACVLRESTAFLAEPARMAIPEDRAKAPFEVHHFADIAAGAATFSQWVSACDERGVSVGGWFQFDKSEQTAFRSLRFAKAIDLFELADEAEKVRDVATSLAGGEARTECLVEQIIGIWRI